MLGRFGHDDGNNFVSAFGSSIGGSMHLGYFWRGVSHQMVESVVEFGLMVIYELWIIKEAAVMLLLPRI